MKRPGHQRTGQGRLRVLAAAGCVAIGIFASPVAASAQAAGAVQIERPMAFDVAKRVMVLTPTLAARLKLSAPNWPLGGDWTEARLFGLDSMAGAPAVLVATRVDGSVARYVLSNDGLARLLRAVYDGLETQGPGADGTTRGGTSMTLSEPAGNAFVRNQTVLGLLAYGPATAAILSESSGAAAGGGYLLAAGTSFFVSAQMIRKRSITRAQTILAFHGGTRGSAAGAAVAEIFDANGGAGYGLPILAGALGGTVAGFRGARGQSDGEAASSGFAADITALTTLGVAGAFGAFKSRQITVFDGTMQLDQSPPTKRRVALGLAIGAGLGGYLVGPRYARRSAYNVTAGDIDVAFTSAALGAVLANAFVSNSVGEPERMAISTGGMLLGVLAADRTKVRHADRTSADGTLVQLGAVAGALIGGGVALITEANGQASAGLIAAGGIAGLAAADALVRPAADAGPKRGVLSTSSGFANERRVSLSIAPAATELLLLQGRRNTRSPIGNRPSVRNVPMLRVAF